RSRNSCQRSRLLRATPVSSWALRWTSAFRIARLGRFAAGLLLEHPPDLLERNPPHLRRPLPLELHVPLPEPPRADRHPPGSADQVRVRELHAGPFAPVVEQHLQPGPPQLRVEP